MHVLGCRVVWRETDLNVILAFDINHDLKQKPHLGIWFQAIDRVDTLMVVATTGVRGYWTCFAVGLFDLSSTDPD